MERDILSVKSKFPQNQVTMRPSESSLRLGLGEAMAAQIRTSGGRFVMSVRSSGREVIESGKEIPGSSQKAVDFAPREYSVISFEILKWMLQYEIINTSSMLFRVLHTYSLSHSLSTMTVRHFFTVRYSVALAITHDYNGEILQGHSLANSLGAGP